MGVGGVGLVRTGLLMLAVSALFEPIRLAVQLFVGDEVGGVGGWGGLSNIGAPEDCSSQIGRTAGWCFKPGVLAGLSPFGLAFVVAWVVLPVLGAAAAAAGLGARRGSEAAAGCREITGAEGPAEEQASSAASQAESAEALRLSRLLRLWDAVSCLWFLLPLSCFASSPFYRTGFWKAILGLGLVGAYPLSWHLALVAVPVSDLVAPRLQFSDPAVKSFHKALGWRTAGWAAMHGFCELLYLCYIGLPQRLNVMHDHTNMIYVLGVVSLVLMAVHWLLALVRKQQWLRCHFRTIHRWMAVALLVCSTAHWPPFALLMLPAAAAHGGGTVAHVARAQGLEPTERRASLAVACAFAGGLLGLAAVWTVRERVLLRPKPDVLLMHAFPPLALAAEGLGGLAGAALALALPPRRGTSAAGDQLLESCPRQAAA